MRKVIGILFLLQLLLVRPSMTSSMRLNRSTRKITNSNVQRSSKGGEDYNTTIILPKNVGSEGVVSSTHSNDYAKLNVDRSNERKLVEKGRRTKLEKRRMIRRRQIDLNQI